MMYDISGGLLQEAYNLFGNNIPVSEPYRRNRLLVFEDDFLGNDINSDNWEKESGHPRGKSYQCKRPGNVTVHDSMLEVSTVKENHLNYTWSCGGIVSRGKQQWVNGRFEAKMKVSDAFNCAFWMAGANTVENYVNDDGTTDYPTQYKGLEDIKSWPKCGELDIVESWNYTQKSQPQCNLWGYESGTSLGHGTFPTPLDTVNKWHIYAVEKTDEYIAAYIDDIEYYRWTFADMDESEIPAYIDKPMNIIIGNGIGDDNDTERTLTQYSMFVDWVRVYAPIGVTDIVPDTSVQTQAAYRMRNGWKSYIPYTILPVTASDMTVKWVSEDETVVRCGTGAEKGYVFAESLGETDIHAITKDRNIATMHITVVPPEDIP